MPSKQKNTSAKRRSKPLRKKRVSKTRGPELALAVFAHEIRTSLTGILALGELLATSGLDEREAGWAAGIKNSAEHLAALINLTIDSVNAESGRLVLQPEIFSLQRLGKTLAASLGARAEAKELRSSATIADGLPEQVSGDAVRMRAAVENLIDNAVKFTDSGAVTFEMAAKQQARGRILVTFTVSDSGIGLKPAEIKRLFKPFTQANEDIALRYGGAGLGLAFVKRVARAMGGDLKVTSKAGKGSRFVMTAVVAKSAAPFPQNTRLGGPLKAEGARALKILCAEDNPYGRVVINAILNEVGHSTDFVGSGEAAVQAVARGGYDLVLMDVMLGDTSGIEATRSIRALPSPLGQVPVIGISGRGAPGDEEQGRVAGMNGYLTKPVSPHQLARLIAEVMAKK